MPHPDVGAHRPPLRRPDRDEWADRPVFDRAATMKMVFTARAWIQALITCVFSGVILFVATAPAIAQQSRTGQIQPRTDSASDDGSSDQQLDQSAPLQWQPTQPATTPSAPLPGRIARSSVGEVGQRQARDQDVNGLRPTARIASRIENRVQSRLRTRIDRTYDPQANATSPFAVAEDQTRAAGRPRR